MPTIRLNGLIAMAVLVSTLAAGTPAHAADNTCWTPRTAERRLATEINGARSSQNLGGLQIDPELSKAARVHTWAMVRQASLFHTPAWRLKYRVTNWVVLGENVGVGGNVDSLHDAFMSSPAHRANVLHASYRHVGVGTVYRGGRLWVTVIFEGVTDPDTPLPMPNC